MSMRAQAVRYGERRLRRRVGRAVPWVGGVIALATVFGAMRRKGVVRGAVDTVLNAIPFVGGVKNAAEIYRGRDFIADRRV